MKVLAIATDFDFSKKPMICELHSTRAWGILQRNGMALQMMKMEFLCRFSLRSIREIN